MVLERNQLHVAQEGISVETSISRSTDLDFKYELSKRYPAAACIRLLGGLTIDQLRWMYSSFSLGELISTGLDATSIPFSDGDDSTHLWSELNEDCTAAEIVIAGPDGGSRAYNFFWKRF